MRKKKILTAVCLLVIIISAFSLSGFAYQSMESFSGDAGYLRTGVSGYVKETDIVDKKSHIKWISTTGESYFKMRFWIQGKNSNSIVSNGGEDLYINTNELNKLFEVDSTCNNGATYFLSAARENFWDKAVNVSGTWEP